MTQAISKIKRSAFATFLNTGTKEVPVWSRFGKGVTSQELAYNAVLSDEQFIHEDSPNKEVDGYSPSLATTQTAYHGEPIFTFIDGIRKQRKTGEGSKSQVLFVNIYDRQGTTEPVTYSAEKNDCAIVIETFGGDAGNSLPIGYSIELSGDPTPGTVVITDGVAVFTPTPVV